MFASAKFSSLRVNLTARASNDSGWHPVISPVNERLLVSLSAVKSSGRPCWSLQ